MHRMLLKRLSVSRTGILQITTYNYRCIYSVVKYKISYCITVIKSKFYINFDYKMSTRIS